MRSCYDTICCPFGLYPFFSENFGKSKLVDEMSINHFNMSICFRKETSYKLWSIYKSLQLEDLRQENLSMISLQYYTEDWCNIYQNNETVSKYRFWNPLL